MKKLSKIVALLLAGAMAMVMLTACSGGGNTGSMKEDTTAEDKVLGKYSTSTASVDNNKALKAEAEKQSEILKAEAEKQALILRADAVREQKVLEATGEAQAIEMVQKALADSIVKLNQAAPNDQVIKLKSLEAFAKAADGKATKLIIPSEIQGLAGMAGSLKEIIKEQ